MWCRLARLASLGLFLVAIAGARGQNTQPGASPGGTVTNPLQIAVRGCLKHIDKSGDYSIADDNGKTWKLTPNGVDLAEHVNHRVLITGKPETAGEQVVGLRVLTVKTLSTTCAP
jgi:hypothetical protein